MTDLTTETQNQIKETTNRSEQLSTECQFLMRKLETIEKEKKSLDKKHTQLVTKSQKTEKEFKEELQINACLQVRYVTMDLMDLMALIIDLVLISDGIPLRT